MSDLNKFVQSRNFVVKMKLDSSGRKGKTVTLLDGFPKMEALLKELTKILKQKCGAGGTYSMDRKDGVIEIQGDHRTSIRSYLEKEGVQVKE